MKVVECVSSKESIEGEDQLPSPSTNCSKEETLKGQINNKKQTNNSKNNNNCTRSNRQITSATVHD